MSAEAWRPEPRTWDASQSTGHRLAESHHGEPEDQGDRRAKKFQDQRCDQLRVTRRVQKFQDQRCDQLRVDDLRKTQQPPRLLEQQIDETAASPHHCQGRDRRRGVRQQTSEQGKNNGAGTRERERAQQPGVAELASQTGSKQNLKKSM